MTSFTFNTTPSVRFGPGLLAQIGGMVGAHRRILLVTDAGMCATGLVAQAEAALTQAGCAVTRFDQVVADPPEAVVNAAAQAAQDADLVIGFGGGSSIDVAKLAALINLSSQSEQKHFAPMK